MPRETLAARRHILVVEDEAKIAEVLVSYLQAAGYSVATAATGGHALTEFSRRTPDLVLLDLMLPDISGEEVCRTLRQQSRVPIIMLTAKVEEGDVLGGFGLGADDYVQKPFSPRQLLARIEAVLRRVSAEPMALAREYSFNQGDLRVDSQGHQVFKRGVPVSLTPNEYNLLLTLLKYPAKVFTREELISFALHDDYAGSDRTIDTYIKNLRQKLEDDTRNPVYLLTMHGIGYRFGGEASAS